MHALIDGDIFCYEFGSAKKDDGSPLQWPFVVSRMDGRIANILNAVGATSHQIYLTGEGNFRVEAATIRPYKGHRPDEKPYWHKHIFDFLVYHRGACVVTGYEADDAVGIAQYAVWDQDEYVAIEDDTVICSRDKDLHMIPGWHYTWPAGKQHEKELWYQDWTGAWRAFFSQLLTGDATDNIPGLFGVGPSSSLVKHVTQLTDPVEMCSYVKQEYVKRFGFYWDIFFFENADLLWIMRKEDERGSQVVTKLLRKAREIAL